jgi:Zinc carboxypeptidase
MTIDAMRRVVRVAGFGVWLAALGGVCVEVVAAQTPRPKSVEPLAPAVKYDARIPTLRQVVGHESGDEITTPDQIVAYLKALTAAAPDRTRLVEYARTWQGRPLYVLVVSSPERIARLDEIKKGLQRLADPRTVSAAEADALVASLPVVTWLIHAVHGNEISGSDAALAEAYHLLAAQGDDAVETILRESIVLIDPLENPDGRARFVLQNHQGRAAIPDPEPASAEHDEPWPGGRTNHYLFDMNRDWFSQSQPETRGRTKLFLEWYPQVVVDLHEMGGESTYYFAPPADPLNPHITKAQAGWFQTFGRANADRFDARGFSYFVREVYDSFYPGYGESWPIFHGAVGMTYEQASARGLIYRRDDDTLLTYRDGVLRHFTAAITTAETAARHRARLLRDFLEYRRTAISEGEQGPVREYVLTLAGDSSRATRLARLLASQGFDVRRAEEAFKVGTKAVSAGAFVLPVAQPASRLLRNLLEPHIAQPDAFLKEQDRRRKKRLNEQIYDITAWSLPLAFDVEVLRAERPTGVRTSPLPVSDIPWMLMDGATPAVSGPETTTAAAGGTTSHGTNGVQSGSASSPTTAGATSLRAAKVGYLLPWGSGTATAVVEALRSGLRVRSADLPFTLGGRAYTGGTAIVRSAENPADLPARLASMAARHGVEVVPIDSAFVERGISLGSGDVAGLKLPRVLLAWDVPTQSLSAGWARFVLERRFGQPVTAVRVGSLGRIDLRRYDVLVLPSGNYGTALAGDALRRLKDWISGGGTLITIAEASRWAARENVGLLTTATELRGGRPEVDPPEKSEPKKTDAPAQPIQLEKAIEPDREPPTGTPGAFLRVNLDLEHWLSAGTDGQIQGLVDGNRVFTPLKLDKGRNVGVYAAQDQDLVVSGLVWDDAKAQLANKAFLMHQPTGRGHVIAFAEDPNFRAFTEATELLFINAVLLGPAH